MSQVRSCSLFANDVFQ